MNELTGTLKVIAPVLLMLGVGIACRKTGALKKSGIDGLKAVVVNVFLPAVLIKAFYQADYSPRIAIVAAAMFIVCIAALALGFSAKKLLRSDARTLPFLMTGFEAGMLGYALYALLFGSVTPFATVDLGQVLFVFTVYFTLLKKGEGGTLKSSLKAMIISPVIISIAVGVAIGASGLGQRMAGTAAGEIVQNVLDFVSAPTAAVILLVVGFELEFKKSALARALAAVGVRLVIMAALCALTLLIVSLLTPVDKPLLWAFILMFLLPPPFVLPVFARGEDESAFVSATLSLSTLVALAAFAVMTVIVA
jgi:predicted permease